MHDATAAVSGVVGRSARAIIRLASVPRVACILQTRGRIGGSASGCNRIGERQLSFNRKYVGIAFAHVTQGIGQVHQVLAVEAAGSSRAGNLRGYLLIGCVTQECFVVWPGDVDQALDLVTGSEFDLDDLSQIAVLFTFIQVIEDSW